MTMRDLIRMGDDEVATYIAQNVRARMSTLNKDGSPHVVPISYAVLDGKVAFWADNDSQKMVNLQRDPRIALIIDDGMDFQELRGVQIAGTAELHDDADTNGRIADLFAAMAPEEHREAAKQMLLGLAAQRTAVVVHPAKVTSWDHRKLGGGARAEDLGR
jgi:PPOX class probable F420-dependent enzyme